MRRNSFRFALLVLLAVLVVPTGCGDDDNPVKGDPGDVIDVRNGTWLEQVSWTCSGSEICTGNCPPDADETAIICGFDLSDDIEGADLDCEITQNGEDFTFACTGSMPLEDVPDCSVTFDFSGTGTATDTTVTIEAAMTMGVSGNAPDGLCDVFDAYLSSCLTEVSAVYTWQSDDGADTCPDDPEAAMAVKSRLAALTLENLVGRR